MHRQIRNSIKYVASKHHKAFMADLKPVYRAVSKEVAETALDEPEAKSFTPQMLSNRYIGSSGN